MTRSDAYEKHLQQEAVMEAIETEIKTTQALTSDLLSIESLRSNYEPQSNFDKGVLYLCGKYKQMRTVRGDGNCYYRAFLYSLCEHLKTNDNEEELQRITNLVKSSIDEFVSKHGYDRFALEMFHEELVELLEALKDTPQNELHTKLNQENATSDYCTWYLRVMVSCFLKSDPDRFVGFLEDGHLDLPTYCAREVEPMGRECTMISVLALAETMGVAVSIEYLDGRDFGDELSKHDFGPSVADANKPTHVTLLYRPGHYDVLYK